MQSVVKLSMMNMNKLLVPLFAATVLVTVRADAAQPTPTNPAPSAKSDSTSTDLFGTTVVAKGKGFEIKRSQLDDDVIRAKSQLSAAGRPVSPDQTALMEQQILDQLINVQLLKAKATDADRAAGKAAAEKRLADVKAKLGSDDAFKRQLTLMGATQEEVLDKWAEALTAEAVLKRELKISITDADAKKYYDDNPSRFEQPEMVRASHILLTTRDASTGTDLSEDKKAAKHKEMEGILKRARAGEDFAKLAKEYSEDPGSKDKGGEYKFPRGQMVPEFEAAAFSLKTNQVSDIVTTSFGYHIIKVSEKIPAQKVDYAKAASDIKDGLSAQAMQKEFPDYVKNLRKEAGVEILDEKLKLKETPETAGLPAGHPPLQPTKKPDSK
jgi:peptidyl-prolyl cis-trans isomerase C